jgi:hypothetical protein
MAQDVKRGEGICIPWEEMDRIIAEYEAKLKENPVEREMLNKQVAWQMSHMGRCYAGDWSC